MAEDLPSPWWVILPEDSMAIRFSFDYEHKSALTFRLFDVMQVTDNHDWVLTDSGDWWELNQWEEAFCTIYGTLKWDGCINWQTNPECMMHGCNPNHVKQITNVFSTIYHVGKRHMDLLGDPVPELPEGAIELPA